MNKNDRIAHYDELINHMNLKDKITYSKSKIKEFLFFCLDQGKNEFLVSFSGGKDSTLLLNLIVETIKENADDFKNVSIVPAYAMEITFPETIKFIKETINELQKQYSFVKNLLLVPPKKPWKDILNIYGFPIFSKQISVQLNRIKYACSHTGIIDWSLGIKKSAKFALSKKRLFLLDKDMNFYIDENGNKQHYYFSEKCCDYVKGGLKHDKRPAFIGTMASESTLRKTSWINFGCNILNNKELKSRPLSIWNADNVWEYYKKTKSKINPCYQFDGEKPRLFNRLGCSACPFGSHLEKHLKDNYNIKNRFEKLKEFNENLYISQVKKTGMEYILMDMNVEIQNDDIYMEKLKNRREQIKKWYINFRQNLFKIMIQIENGKRQKTKWEFTNDEFGKALEHFGENKELTQEDKQYIYIYRKNLKHEN